MHQLTATGQVLFQGDTDSLDRQRPPRGQSAVTVSHSWGVISMPYGRLPASGFADRAGKNQLWIWWRGRQPVMACRVRRSYEEGTGLHNGDVSDSGMTASMARIYCFLRRRYRGREARVRVRSTSWSRPRAVFGGDFSSEKSSSFSIRGRYRHVNAGRTVAGAERHRRRPAQPDSAQPQLPTTPRRCPVAPSSASTHAGSRLPVPGNRNRSRSILWRFRFPVLRCARWVRPLRRGL
jgi:hypothetical protein